MALTTCSECKKEISTDAKVCPHCGTTKPHPKKTSNATWALLALLIIGGISSSMQDKTPEPQKTPEQIKQDAIDTERTSNAIQARSMLKQSLKDPDSLQLDEALTMENKTVCMQYKAKNGFGGYSAESAVYIPNLNMSSTTGEKSFNKIWNKECAGKNGTVFEYHF